MLVHVPIALPPLNVAGVAITAAQLLVFATSHGQEASGAMSTPYSKFAGARSQQPRPVASRAGMLLIYAPAAAVSALAAGAARPSLAAGLLTAHFAKRVFETLCVHRYSGTMPLPVAAFISFYYACVALGVSAVATPTPACAGAATALFAVGAGGNLFHHYLLARLRAPSAASADAATEYKPPAGGLFELVAAPHYLFELVGWFGIALAAEHLNALLVALCMSSYLSGRAVATSRWNSEKFGSAWPESRGHLVPFVF